MKTQRIAWVREYRYNRGTYDAEDGGWTRSIVKAKLFDRRKEAAVGGHGIPVKVRITVERVSAVNATTNW